MKTANWPAFLTVDQLVPMTRARLSILFGLLLALPINWTAANSYYIDSQESFAIALDAATAGDTIAIAAGHYKNWTVVIDAEGSETEPITIEPEEPGTVAFTGTSNFEISGKHIHIKGLIFEDFEMVDRSSIQLDQAKNCRVSNILFQKATGNRPVVRFMAGAQNNILERSRFKNIAGRSVNIHVNETAYERGIPSGNVIRGNRFEDIPPIGGNGRETIKIGQNQPEFGHIKTYALVEGNTFIRANGEGEIISNKSSNNIYRQNTFLDCRGELVMRGGSYCLIENNRFYGCSGGIRLSGTNHKVRGNLIVNSDRTGIRLLYGMTTEQGGHYQTVRNCVVTRNTVLDAGSYGILIGDGRDRDWEEKGMQSIAPRDNRFENNLIRATSGRHIQSNHAPNNIVTNNILRQRFYPAP